MSIQFPPYAEKLFDPYRYKVLHGGRGSGKSYTVARALLAKAATSKRRVLCAREFQNSITESVHKLLSDQAEEIGLQNFFHVSNHSIVGENGSEFIFRGVRMNVNSIKSMVGITDLWLEEAHTISQMSWDVLIPTIREPDSEIWVTFNPDDEDDPTYKMFLDGEGKALPRDDALILQVNWQDNPWFPEVLAKEKDHLFRVNPDLAMHVWEGKVRKNSDSQIFRHKWEVREFEAQPEFDGPYLGADFGFSTDPSTIVEIYIDVAAREILIRRAIFGYHVEIDDLPEMYGRIPKVKSTKIRADCARPETISYLNRAGFDIEGAEKWSGSVEDGIEWLKSFNKIVIHPECEEMISEAKNYSFKTDRLTGDVLTDVVDAYNHGWDAVRYGLQPMIQAGTLGILDVL